MLKYLGSPGLRIVRCYLILSQDDSCNQKTIALTIIFVKWIIVKCITDVFQMYIQMIFAQVYN
jgi:hypothetical protein